MLCLLSWMGAGAFTADGLNYSLKDGAAVLMGATSTSITSLTVPATVTYGGVTYPVNYIEYNSFDNYKSLRSVRFEDSEEPILAVAINYQTGVMSPSPFYNCPVEDYYFGRPLAVWTSSGALSSDAVYVYSTADQVSLSYGGNSTLMPQDKMFSEMSADKITSITLGGNVSTSRAYSCFWDCHNIKNVTFNPGDYSIGSLFPDAAATDSLTLNRTNLTIASFYNIKHIVFGEGWESIPQSFCSYRHSLRSISLPSTLHTIERYAFEHCDSLEEVKGGENLKIIDSFSFYYCTSLVKTNFMESLVTIGQSAFANCTKLPSPVFGNKLETIGSVAFSDCISITEVTIPGSVTKIDSSAFSDCTGLKKVTFDESVDELTLDNSFGQFTGVKLDSMIMNRVISSRGEAITKYAYFGECWKTIPAAFFLRVDSLVSVSLPSTLQEIGKAAFEKCTSLEVINIPESLRTIGNNAFYDCVKLPSPVFGNQLETIEHSAFYNCSSISEITIPGSVTDLGQQAFNGCSNLKKIIFEKSDKAITFDNGGPVSPFDETVNDSLILNRVIPTMGYRSGKAAPNPRHVVFGEGWEVIPEMFLYGRKSLISVSVPSTLRVIGKLAFGDCTSLERINIPNSLTTIEDEAFRKCSSLEKIGSLDSVRTIGNSAFYDCAKLPSPVLGDKLETIGTYVFSGCSSITEIIIPGSVMEMGIYAFKDCSGVKKIVLEASENQLSVDYNMPPFTDINADGLDSLVLNRVIAYGYRLGTLNPKHVCIGEGWETIRESFMRDASSMKTLSLPSTLKSIGLGAFQNSVKLDSIFVKAKVPPTCNYSDIFPADIYPTALLSVPLGSKRKYTEAQVWKNFVNIKTDGVLLVTVDYDRSKVEVTINGEKTDSLELDEGEALDIIVTPLTGFTIESMIANGEDCTERLVNGALHYDEINDTLAFEVKFAPIMLDIKLSSDIEGGRVDINGSKDVPASLQYGSRIELRPLAETGYQIKEFSVNGNTVTLNADGAYVIESLTEAINIVAVFEIIRFQAAAKYDSTRGVVLFNGKTGDVDVDYGTSLTITATPVEGNYVDSMIVNGSAVSREQLGKPVTISSVTEDVKVDVRFEVYTYIVAAKYDNDMGSVSINGSEGSADVAWGTDAVFVITPAYGYQIASVALDGKDVTDDVDAASGTFVISSVKTQHDIAVVFEPKRVRLSIVLEGGVLTTIHDFGTELRYFPEADKNWVFHSATVGENVITELDTDGSFLTGALTDDTSISIVFRSNESSIGQIATDNPVGVTVRNHTVVITGASDDAVAEIYDVAGLCYYRGRDREISIEKDGVYVVTICGQSFKVILR